MTSVINKALNNLLLFFPENNRLERIWKLAQVDFRKRYYNDRFGILWALLNPVFRVLIYYVVFSIVFKTVVAGIDNYGLFIFSGLIIWMAFLEISKKSMKLIQHKKYLIMNIKVQKIDLYLSNGLAILMGFGFNLFAYLIISIFFGTTFSINIFVIPILIINLLLISIGFGMILSVLYIYFEDIVHVIDLVFLIGFWSSGIFFRGEMFQEYWPPIMLLNPFIGLIINFREIILYNGNLHYNYLILNFTFGIIIFALGYCCLYKFSYKAIERL